MNASALRDDSVRRALARPRWYWTASWPRPSRRGFAPGPPPLPRDGAAWCMHTLRRWSASVQQEEHWPAGSGRWFRGADPGAVPPRAAPGPGEIAKRPEHPKHDLKRPDDHKHYVPKKLLTIGSRSGVVLSAAPLWIPAALQGHRTSESPSDAKASDTEKLRHCSGF